MWTLDCSNRLSDGVFDWLTPCWIESIVPVDQGLRDCRGWRTSSRKLKGDTKPLMLWLMVSFVYLNKQGYTVYLHGYRVPFLLDNCYYLALDRVVLALCGCWPEWLEKCCLKSVCSSSSQRLCSSQISLRKGKTAGFGSAISLRIWSKPPHSTRKGLTLSGRVDTERSWWCVLK